MLRRCIPFDAGTVFLMETTHFGVSDVAIALGNKIFKLDVIQYIANIQSYIFLLR